MATKAKLTILLKADSTVVAESDDAALWQQVLLAMQSGVLAAAAPAPLVSPTSTGDAPVSGDKAIANFAKNVGVSLGVLVGALSPSREPPYLHLDRHCWAQMKKDTAKRGPGAISPTGLAGTLLGLWFKDAKLDMQATQALAAEVLKTIDVRDPNASRGIKNTKWLQGRSGGAIVINAAEFSKALDVARSFCTKSWKPST